MKAIKGRIKKPIAMLLYTEAGVGKSTFGTEADDPIFLGSEENDELDVNRLPKIKTWKEFLDQLDWVKTCSHKTLVIDTMDELEIIGEKLILSTEKGKTMATARGAYGKAYDELYTMMLDVRERLVYLRDEKGMNIIILCHEEKTKHEDPITLTSYDTYSTALHKKIKPIFHDWVSIIAFAKHRFLKVENSSGKDTVIGDGERVIFFEDRPSHTAKNRFNLPEEMDFTQGETWKMIKEYHDEFFKSSDKPKTTPKTKEEAPKVDVVKNVESNELDHDLISEINETIGKIKNHEIKPKIEVSLARAKTNEELKRILEKAKTLV